MENSASTTEREQEILRLLRENPLISQKELADRCNITRSSIGVHISNLMKKGVILGKGYMLNTEPYIAVVGGAILDMSGRSSIKVEWQDSSVGKIIMSPGGVGRNIAHNLALLGQKVRFISAFGDDAFSIPLVESCRRVGVNIDDAVMVPGTVTAVCLTIADSSGEIKLAVSDVDVCGCITPAFLSVRMGIINKSMVCASDTNISEEALVYLAKNCKTPFFVAPVSKIKVRKAASIIPLIHTMILNRFETQELVGMEISGEDSLAEAAGKFISMGLSQVFITMEEHGVYYAGKSSQGFLAAQAKPMKNANGKDDSFMAAIIWAFLQGFTTEKAARAGLEAAFICAADEQTVSANISEAALRLQMGEFEPALENISADARQE
ncbi:MAG: PfkB family carbohydrate kinase [Clostridiales bacterium]|nr:PfkB family carbohydrate kinase [Clostridiales bacterium]